MNILSDKLKILHILEDADVTNKKREILKVKLNLFNSSIK